MKITLVRHAEVDEAYHGCYNGHIDIGLSKRGEEQAIALAEMFSASEFDALYCSDLLRAKKTMQYFPYPKSTSSLSLSAFQTNNIHREAQRKVLGQT